MARSTNWCCKKKKLVSYKLKLEVMNGKCYLCDNCIDTPSLDHVVPVSRGGVNAWSNILWACLSCNTSKLDRAPTKGELLLLETVNDECLSRMPMLESQGLWKRKTVVSRIVHLVKVVSTFFRMKYFAFTIELLKSRRKLEYIPGLAH